MGRRFVVLLVMVSVLVSLNASTASSAASRTDTVKGTEVAFTSTQGTFAGYADGDLDGTWTAVIDHTTLSPNATITGGTFTLYTLIHWIPKTVDGTFANGGTVTRLYQATGCGTQKYAVQDNLVHVGIGGGSGTGNVSAMLTHYRHSVFGHCVAYAATISGTVTLTF